MTTVTAPNATATPLVPVLRAVLVADLVDSTALLGQLGDARAAALMQRHELHLRNLIVPTRGQLIDKADGVLVLFERPINAVDFALRYQRMLTTLAQEFGLPPLKARVGIHVGEVMTWANDPRAVAAGAKPIEVEGLAKPVAARLMSLALPGQILLSGMAQSLAERASAELGDRAEDLRWEVHGRYRFKGVPAPMLVHEVGEPGLSPLKPPVSGPKAWRELPLWRRPPVLALEIAVALGIAAASLYGTFKSEPALAFNQRDWVVVGDLNNLTDESELTDPLRTALRIGLQQSAYVNLISDQRVDETLQRMGRAADTPVDRAIGSEIAAREGARAVILPTLTEVGGEMRISLELIDPVSQATVYSAEAASRDTNDMLDALDGVLEKLRGQLGESVASIEKTTIPLEQATTPNLDAFRAYTLGQQAKAESRFGDAIALQERALKLDPDFALAYIALASLQFATGDDDSAYENLQHAQAKRSRLSLRENLYLDGASTLYSPLDPMLEKWRLVAAMYPDEYRAHYNYAIFASLFGNLYSDSFKFLDPALTSQNPARASAYFLRGNLLLALERSDEAIDSFKQAELLGVRGDKGSMAAAYGAQRRFNEAESVLSSQTATGAESTDLFKEQTYATLWVDQGRWDDAISLLEELERKARPVSMDLALQLGGSELSLRSYAPDDDYAADLKTYLRNCGAEFVKASPARRYSLAYQLVAVAGFAARSGHVDSAIEAIERAKPYAREAGRPALDWQLAIAEAEVALSLGNADKALALLSSKEIGMPYMAHAALLRAHAAVGDTSEAQREADWLATHRGLAYAEMGNAFMLQAANVAESNLALLASAELHQRTGDHNLAEKQMTNFKSAWTTARAKEIAGERTRLLFSKIRPSG